MNNKKIISIIALACSVFIHGVVFSVPAYLYYLKYGKLDKKNNSIQNPNQIYTIETSILPDIKIIGDKTSVKQNKKNDEKFIEKQIIGNQENNMGEISGDENTDREMLAIYDYIKRKIQENKKYPYQAKKENIEGVVELQFSVANDGLLKNVNIIKSSGYSILDEEALATIKRSAPYPEIQNKLDVDNLQLQVKLIYKIE